MALGIGNMDTISKLFNIADQLENTAGKVPEKELEKIESIANAVGKSWSGSCLGYHSKVYYKNFEHVPPGARFSKEWGFKDSIVLSETLGEWVEYDFDNVVSHIQSEAKITDTELFEKVVSETTELFDDKQSEILSTITTILSANNDDSFLNDLVEKVRNIKVYTPNDYLNRILPSGQQMSRDTNAIQAGIKTPPHIFVLSAVFATRAPFTACKDLSRIVRRLAFHMENINQTQARYERVGSKVFIGHGRSAAWRDLKDFIHDRLHLPWDEFNRVPVAGVTNITRLSEMLDNAAIAFIIMTAEDEQAGGKMHARMNVIHEAGLFQGRLGFGKAILFVEEGCEEFSNVQGLGQIRFPTGNISAIFEEIRRVLEREKLID